MRPRLIRAGQGACPVDPACQHMDQSNEEVVDATFEMHLQIVVFAFVCFRWNAAIVWKC